jgi:hypothetical protein
MAIAVVCRSYVYRKRICTIEKYTNRTTPALAVGIEISSLVPLG